jgi:hypothetical protein
MFRFPEIDRVEIVEVRVVVASPLRLVVVPPTVTEAQLIVPAPAIVAAVFAPAAFRRVMPVVTVRVTPVLTVKVAVLVLLLLKAIELIVAFAVTVTESPARITTSSVESGTVPPGQGALLVVEFQFPLPAVVMVAAAAGIAVKNIDSSTRTLKMEIIVRFMFMLLAMFIVIYS